MQGWKICFLLFPVVGEKLMKVNRQLRETEQRRWFFKASEKSGLEWFNFLLDWKRETFSLLCGKKMTKKRKCVVRKKCVEKKSVVDGFPKWAGKSSHCFSDRSASSSAEPVFGTKISNSSIYSLLSTVHSTLKKLFPSAFASTPTPKKSFTKFRKKMKSWRTS